MTPAAARLFGAPTAARGGFPYFDHRTVAEVDQDVARTELLRVHSPFYIAPVGPDRSPCPRCGVRHDIGCSHRSAVDGRVW